MTQRSRVAWVSVKGGETCGMFPLNSQNLHSVSWCSTDRVYNVKNNPVLLFCPDTVLRKVLRTTRATPQRYVAFEENVSIEKLLLYKGNAKAKNKVHINLFFCK